MRIPLYSVRDENLALAPELEAAFRSVLATGRFSGGDELKRFEARLAEYCGTGEAIGVKSGTDAIVMSLMALGIGPGDEVITSPFTFIATAEAILQTGAAPAFADVDPQSLCITAEACAKVVGPHTKAVLAVHVFGHSCDMDSLAAFCFDRRVALVEDAAQAIGATFNGRKLGSIGVCGTFSFYPTKNLSTLGNGGAIVTSDDKLASAIRSLQDHGRENGAYTRVGWSSHLDELPAAFLNVKLARLEADLSRRRTLAARYDAELPTELWRVRGATGCISNYHQYGVRTSRRDALRECLSSSGVETGDYYRTPLHREPVTQGRCRHAALPETELACSEVLTLPIRPSLTDAEQSYIIESVRAHFRG